MNAFTVRWTPGTSWSVPIASHAGRGVQLLLAFGPVTAPAPSWFAEVRALWPDARLVYCTAGGQIDGVDVMDDPVVLTGFAFDRAQVQVLVRSGLGQDISCEQMAGALAAEMAAAPALRHVLVFADGLHVNGAALTRGFTDGLPAGVTVSGGLASDGMAFATTGVGVDGPPQPGTVVAVGLSGTSLVIGTGSVGGWEPFGPERLVTRAEGTTVQELDGEPALEVYRRYLGSLADELPGSALLFPLAMTATDGGPTVVRTILGIDEMAGALRFAGDVPRGVRVRLMRATSDRLLDGAQQAARAARAQLGDVEPTAMLCVSCIGRRVVLRSRIAEEIDEVAQAAGDATLAGFYSNGEIAPPDGGSPVALFHNQTMTVTAFGER
jgi:hypothetical protein